MNLWPHQERGIKEALAAIDNGQRRILLTSPTGGGKTRIMEELARNHLGRGRKVVLYTNRKLLVEQTSSVLAEAGLEHGVRAAGYGSDRHLDLQIASIQTEDARSLKRQRWKLHEADLVLIDEAHVQKGKVVQKILKEHLEKRAAYVGFTATPLDLGDLYDRLLIAGTPSELRLCGALVPCHHYGPDEPDLRKIRGIRLGEDLSESQQRKAMMRPGIFGRVYDNWRRLNPDGKPTILFAPGVPESIWFCDQFRAKGVTAAHIDGQEIYRDGRLERTTREGRTEVLGRSRDGLCTVLCNRFVLREGINAPWLAHGILATVFGSLQSYLQAGGRLLRTAPGLECVTVQDHGGNWWRHGSLNADREWRLDWTSGMVAGMRADRMRNKSEAEPFRCPGCGMIWMAGAICRRDWGGCGYELLLRKRSRPVVQIDGTLKHLVGEIHRPRRICTRPDGPKLWEKMYHRSRTERGRRTFRAAAALFAQENYWGWPDPGWPFMPTVEEDWYRDVATVPRERLTHEHSTV